LKLSPATGPDAGLTHVTLPFHDGTAFLDAYSADEGPAGGLTLDPRVNLAVGQEVKLLLRFRNGTVKEFDVRGRVAWRRARPAGERPAGIGVEFLEAEKTAVERLVALA